MNCTAGRRRAVFDHNIERLKVPKNMKCANVELQLFNTFGLGLLPTPTPSAPKKGTRHFYWEDALRHVSQEIAAVVYGAIAQLPTVLVSLIAEYAVPPTWVFCRIPHIQFHFADKVTLGHDPDVNIVWERESWNNGAGWLPVEVNTCEDTDLVMWSWGFAKYTQQHVFSQTTWPPLARWEDSLAYRNDNMEEETDAHNVAMVFQAKWKQVVGGVLLGRYEIEEEDLV